MHMEQQISFNDLQINPLFLEKLLALHIHNPTTIQQRIIPLLQENNNILFQSETGTGKTFAYLLPLLDKISTSTPHVQLIILAPTYELASQIKSQIQLLTNIKTALFIGGVPIKRQIETLKEKPLIIVGGPARILELLFLKKLKEKIKKRICTCPVNGIHFIDSGNFHYVSEFYLERLTEEFVLVVFDHHSDMLKPLFGDILSCGSWILNAMEHNKYLKKVILITKIY